MQILVPIKFYWNTTTSICLYIPYHLFGTVIVELSSYDRDLLAQKPSLNIYYLVFLQKNLADFYLRACQDSSTQMFNMYSLCYFSKGQDKKAVVLSL